MKFLVDAHLPPRLVQWFKARGHDAIHTRDLPHANSTPDSEIIAVADRDGRVVITKDSDFVSSHSRHGRPARLLVIAVGNTSNPVLLDLLDAHLPAIVASFDVGACVEVTQYGVVVRGFVD